jgi:cysteine desulfurase/selenocysteine lyase
VKYALEKLSTVEGLEILGPKDPEKRSGLVSFVISGMHPHDIATILDSQGIAVRSGHHCAMPLHKKLQISASTRASFNVYNTTDDIDKLVAGLEKARERLL